VKQKVELIEIAVWLLLAGFGLLTAVLASGCQLPNGPDRGWLTNQQHHWNYRWTPLHVNWSRINLDYHEDSARLAMEHFPCDMFKEWNGEDNPDVEVYWADGSHERCNEFEFVHEDPKAQAFVYHCKGFAEIYLSGSTLALDTTKSYLVFAHELGHVAGLMHDGSIPGFCPSIMEPSPAAHSKALEEGRCLPGLTYSDRDMLESRYCPR